MSLLDEIDADVIAFKPERAGESVEGEVVALDVTGSEYTEDEIPVITLKDADGVFRGVRGYHSVLRARLADLNLKVGDSLAIRYEGKKQNRKGTGSYHNYSVRKAAGSQGSASADDVAPF